MKKKMSKESMEETDIKILSEQDKQKLRKYLKNYREAKKLSL